MKHGHCMPFGAEVGDGGVRFRLWAPAAETVALRLEGAEMARMLDMAAEPDGWWQVETKEASSGTRYRYLVNDETVVPDPASRFQPHGVRGASEIVDPLRFEWSQNDWHGRPWPETVLYELHVGTFTSEGTFRAIIPKLNDLAELGVTAVELMPVAATPGSRNWGYDGVLPYAPNAAYGRPQDLKALVDGAHARGLMMFLDVVYNHFGPEGNYLHVYAPQFFTDRYQTPWGQAIDFDSRVVRDYFIHNALYWIEEYRFDGLRLDAVHAIRDSGRPHILEELSEAVAGQVGEDRHVHLVLENDDNAARYLERRADGRPRFFVAQWNDDIHHAFHVLTTGEGDGYYADYSKAPAGRLGRCLTQGFAYQGDASVYRGGTRRGEPSAHLPSIAFVSFIQNHDQVGNRAFGERLARLADPAAVKAAAAIYLLAPSPPMIFMGEEWAAAQPFLFFCDFGSELAAAVTEGRRSEFARFAKFRDRETRDRIPDPNSPATFNQSVLNWADRAISPHRDWLAHYRTLLTIRQREIVPRLASMEAGAGRYEVWGNGALSVDWRLTREGSLRLITNMSDVALQTEPIKIWEKVLFASEPELAGRIAEGVLPPWSVIWFVEPEPA